MAKQIVHGEESQQAILRGVNLMADAVKVTLGPRGRKVVIEKRFGPPTITKDRVTVAKAIELQDGLEDWAPALKPLQLCGNCVPRFAHGFRLSQARALTKVESLLDSYRTVNDVGACIDAEQGLGESRPSSAGSLMGT